MTRQAIASFLILGFCVVSAGAQQDIPSDTKAQLLLAWSKPDECLAALRLLITYSDKPGNPAMSSKDVDALVVKHLSNAGVTDTDLLQQALQNRESLKRWLMTVTAPTDQSPDAVEKDAGTAVDALYALLKEAYKTSLLGKVNELYPQNQEEAFLSLLEAYPKTADSRLTDLARLRAAYGLNETDWSVFTPVHSKVTGNK